MFALFPHLDVVIVFLLGAVLVVITAVVEGRSGPPVR